MRYKLLLWHLKFPIWLTLLNPYVGLVDKAKVGLRGYLVAWALFCNLKIIDEVLRENLELVMTSHHFEYVAYANKSRR